MITLEKKYNSQLPYNRTFKEEFRKQVLCGYSRDFYIKVFLQIMFCYLVLIHCYSLSVIDAVSFVLISHVDVARLCRMRHCYLSVPPLMWNSLPATIEQVTRYGQFRQHLKTHFWEPRNRSALWLLIIARCTNTLTYLLTHLLMKQTNAQTQTQHRRKCPKHSDAKNQFLRLYLLFVYGFLMQTTRLPRAVWSWLIYCSFVVVVVLMTCWRYDTIRYEMLF